MADTTAFITLENISKQFPGVLALDNVNLTLRKGEVHCLAGQNGCGKSTIIKVISGVYHPEKGAQILLDGKLFHHLTPQLSSHYGIQVIYQDLSLFPNFSVAENIAVNRYLPGGDIWVRRGAMKQQALAAMKRIGVNIDPDKKVEKLSIADRQLVAICRAIAADARLVIMDEPTASLTRQEVNGLLRVVNELKAAGICVVFVSHRLDEVMEVADRISVMRDGKLVGTYPASELDSRELAFLMTGQRFHYSPLPERPAIEQEPLLELRNLSRRGKYQNINLSLHGGEIVCLAGIEGNGQTEFIYGLTGLSKLSSGKLTLDGKDITHESIRQRSKDGMGHIPEDRHKHGLVLDFSLENNIVLQRYWQPEFQKGGFIRADKVREYSDRLIKQYDVRSGQGSLTTVRSMSGGNQQKAIIAREIDRDPKLLVAVQPTRGLDVGAIEYIHRQIVAERDKGKAVLLVSLELDEVMNLSDRILVMYEGEIVGEFDPKTTTVQELGLYMAGARKQGKEEQ